MRKSGRRRPQSKMRRTVRKKDRAWNRRGCCGRGLPRSGREAYNKRGGVELWDGVWRFSCHAAQLDVNVIFLQPGGTDQPDSGLERNQESGDTVSS